MAAIKTLLLPRTTTISLFQSYRRLLISNSPNYSTETTNGNVSKEESDKSKEDTEYEDNIKKKILKSSMAFVNKHGWTKETISEGAEAVGYPGVVHGMFPHGGADLVNYFYITCNETLVEEMKKMKEDTNKLKPEVFIGKAIETRLRMIIPYKEKWPQALGIMAMPPNVPLALSNLLTLADDLCHYAGDSSVDFTWYSRRIAVGGIYKITELYFIQDKSEDHHHTWSFLNKRLEEAVEVQTFLQSSGEASQTAREAISATFDTARNMLRSWSR